MRRWIAAAARLYPREWRARYGEEFDALVDDATADWRQLLNVSRTALAMQFARRAGALKMAAALSLAGGMLALAASYSVPPRYVSTATLRITPVIEGARPAPSELLRRETEDRISFLQNELTGRDNMLRILRDPGLDVFPAERQDLPLEDLAEKLHDEQRVRIEQVQGQGTTVRISVAYPDPAKAQAVVRMLERELRERNDAINREYAAKWTSLWSTPIPFSERVELADPAGLPTAPVEPRRAFFVAAGIAGSLLLGALALFVRRRPKAALRIAACGLLGAIAFAGASLLISERYTSTATIRLTAPFDPAHYYGLASTVSLDQWLPRLQKQILNRENVLRILSEQKIAAGRSGVLNMGMKGRDLLEISVTCDDPFKARALAVEMVSEVQADHGKIQLELDKSGNEQVRLAHEHRAGEKLQMVTQPSSDNILVTHYRLLLTLAGATLGMLFAAIRYRTSMNGESSLSL